MNRAREVLLKVLLGLGVAMPAVAGEFWSDMRVTIGKANDAILISHKLCSTELDCVSKELHFEGGSLTKTEVFYYGITDASTISDLIDACLAAYEKKNRKEGLTVSFYRKAHRELMGTWASTFAKPFVRIEFEAEE